MDDFRGILAALCAGAGLLLIVISIFRTSGEKKSARLTWLYACLFLLVGIVLWRRSAQPNIVTSPSRERVSSEKITPQSDQNIAEKADSSHAVSAPKVTPEQSLSKTETSTSSIQASGQATENNAAVAKAQTPQNATQASEQSVPVRTYAHDERPVPEPSISKKAVPAPDQQDWTDRIDFKPERARTTIYQSVEHAFEWVERFFDEHGNESSGSSGSLPVQQRDQSAQTRNLTRPNPPSFPAVTFYVGTAELTGASQDRLRQLAASLKEHADMALLEVQARVDSLGPEAFNYLLTEARAATVRDFLVSEGVPADRVVARGIGSSALNAPKENSDIQFVVRR